jgi:hypothetical protein
MARELKIGVHRHCGDPEFRWNVIILDLAFNDASEFLDEAQYHHVAEQVQELAREVDPTHPLTQTVTQIEDILELKDKGGPLGNINVRVFFVLDKPRVAIVVLGAIFKQNNGPTPIGAKRRMQRRKRKYFSGDYGEPEIRKGASEREHGEKGEAQG